MVSIVSSTEQSQIIYPVDDVDGPAPSRSTDDESKVSLSIVQSTGGGADLPAPRTTDFLTQSNALELGGTDSQTDIEDVMKLVYEWANKTRQAERAVRQSELKAQVDLLLASAQKLRDAAEANFKAALVEGVMGIAGGMLTIGCNLQAFKVAKGGLDSEREAAKLRKSGAGLANEKVEAEGPQLNSENAGPKKATEDAQAAAKAETQNRGVKRKQEDREAEENNQADRAQLGEKRKTEQTEVATQQQEKQTKQEGTAAGGSDKDAKIKALEDEARMAQAKSMAWNGVGQGLSQMMTSAGSIGGAVFKLEADNDNARSKELDAFAQTHQAASEQANDRVHDMQELMQDILQKMAAVIQIQHDTISKIVG